MPVIDVWAQILTEKMANAQWMSSLYRWTKSSPQQFLSGPKGAIAAMNEAGVDILILSAWYGPEGVLISNEEVAQQIEFAPHRFRGLASADIRQPAAAVRELRQWLHHPSFVGVRIVPWLWELPPDDRRFYPIYATCVELGVPVCTQIGHTGPLRASDSGRPIPYLENVMLDFPDLVVVGGHLGFPWIDEVISMTVKFPNFYVDTSAYVANRFPRAFVEYLNGIGSSRTMFGSNWPMLSPRNCLEGIDVVCTDEKIMSNFKHAVAASVFKTQPALEDR